MLEAAEFALDHELGRVPALSSPQTVAVLAPTGGLGRTTLAFLLADMLAATRRMRTLAVALSHDGDRISQPATPEHRTALCLSDLIDDLQGFDEEATSLRTFRRHPRARTCCAGRRATTCSQQLSPAR